MMSTSSFVSTCPAPMSLLGLCLRPKRGRWKPLCDSVALMSASCLCVACNRHYCASSAESPTGLPCRGRGQSRVTVSSGVERLGGLLGVTRSRAREQQLALGVVAAELGGALELLARLVQPAQTLQDIAAHARQQVVVA